MKIRLQYLTNFLLRCVVIGAAGSLVSCGRSASEMNDETVIVMPTAAHSIDSAAAAATTNGARETIEAALANQPTLSVVPLDAEATMQAAINATLTALAPTSTPSPRPTATPTPNLDATKTAIADWMVTAVAATLTAQAQSEATQMAQSSARALTMAPAALGTPASWERINFPRGSTTYTFSPQLTADFAKGYILRTLAGQSLFVTSSNLIRFAVLDPDNFELPAFPTSSGQLLFRLPKTGDYTLIIAGEGSATIAIDVPPLPQQIQFTPGSTSATFTISLDAHVSHAYTLWVAAGQQIFVKVNQPIQLLAFAPNGSELISILNDPLQWQFGITQSGDQSLFLTGVGDVTVTIIIPPL